MACSMSIERGQNPHVNGYALILTNDYTEVSSLPGLKGTQIDGLRMQETMKCLNFETHWEHNAPSHLVFKLVREAAKCKYLLNYRRLVFIFSGHGNSKHCIYAQDGKDINLNDVMKQYYPDQSPHNGSLPKLFFIDACRGSREALPVLIKKGGRDVSLMVPERSNFLVAYSTMPDYRAYESREEGGIWMAILAEMLKTTEASLLDVLTKVNVRLSAQYHRDQAGCYQQPELISRLNEEVYLLREARSNKSGKFVSYPRDDTIIIIMGTAPVLSLKAVHFQSNFMQGEV